MTAVDELDVTRARAAPGLLRDFNDAGVLNAADVHVARRLAVLAGEEEEWVWLATALAVRSPRLGHVYVDLATIRETAAVDAEELVEVSALPWPTVDLWRERVAASPLVAVGEDPDVSAALRLTETSLYLDRYWREERRLADDLRARSDEPAEGVNEERLVEGLARVFPTDTDSDQRMAVAAAVLNRFAVVGGGPGTGKTTAVARIVAMLAEQALGEGAPEPLVALTAPTGKAAARLAEAVHEQAASLHVSDTVRDQLLNLNASTLHRLLGRRPGSHTRFSHHRANRLPHDAVVVDETSMVSLSLMARLVEAVRPDARLILVGDPGQLTSVEAGAVLGDIVGPASDRPVMRARARGRLAAVTGQGIVADRPASRAGIGDGIVVLERVRRYGGSIALIAEAIRRGDADAVLGVLAKGADDVTWLAVDAAEAGRSELAPVFDGAAASARAVTDAARVGAAPEAIDALGAFRVLCAHRLGPHGVATWMARIQSRLADEIDDFEVDDSWYIGRPLLVTENDYSLRLYNGDTGVVVATEANGVRAAFERGGRVVEVLPTRLSAVDTVYAMTIHKSQGSQFETAAVLLPPRESRILTRELLYTAVTRAQKRLILVGTEEMVRAAVCRPVARASGLRARIWGEPPG